jgi:hypothetical protein
MIRRLLSLGVKAEVIQLSFSVGAVCGMLWMAVLLTLPKVLFVVARAVL